MTLLIARCNGHQKPAETPVIASAAGVRRTDVVAAPAGHGVAAWRVSRGSSMASTPLGSSSWLWSRSWETSPLRIVGFARGFRRCVSREAEP